MTHPSTGLAPIAETDAATLRPLTPAAERALKEAAERRAAAATHLSAQTVEIGGQKGPDPVRYGDWENGGIVSDF